VYDGKWEKKGSFVYYYYVKQRTWIIINRCARYHLHHCSVENQIIDSQYCNNSSKSSIDDSRYHTRKCFKQHLWVRMNSWFFIVETSQNIVCCWRYIGKEPGFEEKFVRYMNQVIIFHSCILSDISLKILNACWSFSAFTGN